MKYLLLLPLLTSCSALPLALTAAVADPTVQAPIAKTVDGITAGDWGSAAVGAVSTVGAIITVIAGRFVRNTLIASKQGSLV